MLIPLSWLKEYINLPQSPGEIADILTMLGLEVDSIENLPPSFEKVVVARIISVEKHPNADNLSLVKVDDGTDTLEVVCGGSNCRPEMKVALAPVGATLQDDEGKTFKLKRAKIRGVESAGMLCTGKELHLSDSHEGILELPEDLIEGTQISDLYQEVVFEISVTPNLGHCASLLGVLRELSASTGEPFHKPKGLVEEDSLLPVDKLAKVRIVDEENCPRYACRVIQGVKVGPSPHWLKSKLELCGIRSINNVVDVTNFVLMEMGHPLHAFDYDRLEGHQIVVRAAKEEDQLVTLDAKERLLTHDTLLICDERKPVALAGIMGGLESEVGLHTTNILLESAYFNPKSIRKTSKRLALQTDASWRFERGSDPNIVLAALDRATMLIHQVAGGRVAAGVIDVKKGDFHPLAISCRVSRIRNVLGAHLSLSEIENVFQRLHFSYNWQDQDTLLVQVPTYRADIHAEIDLIEEVARIYGYDNISEHAVHFQASSLPHAPIFLFEREMRSRLIAEGLQEFLNCDLIGPKLLELVSNGMLNDKRIVRVMNPASLDQSILRPSLLPGLLEVVKYNYDHQNPDISGFEIGRIHVQQEELYKEQSMAAVVLSGRGSPYHWGLKSHEVDFYDLKGIVENVLKELGINENLRFEKSTLEIFHSGRQAVILSDSLQLGHLGEIHPTIVRRLDIPQRIFYAEFHLHDLIQMRKTGEKMQELALYPSSERDWTITLKKEISIGDVFSAIKSISSNLLEEVSLLDVYCSERLGKERKNVTFHFVYRDRKKTVSQQEVDEEHANLTQETLRLLGKAVI